MENRNRMKRPIMPTRVPHPKRVLCVRVGLLSAENLNGREHLCTLSCHCERSDAPAVCPTSNTVCPTLNPFFALGREFSFPSSTRILRYLLLLLALLPTIFPQSHAQHTVPTLHVDTNLRHMLNSFDPDRALGSSIDVLSRA